MKKLYHFFLKITGRKEKKYRIFLALSLFIGAFVLWNVLVIAKTVYSNIKMRTPFNDNAHVKLHVPETYAKFFPTGTHLYSYTPNLELAGFVEGIEDSQNEKGYKYLKVSVLDKHRGRVLRKNTKFKLLHASPSFYTLLLKSLNDEGERQFLFSLDHEYAATFDKKHVDETIRKEFTSRGLDIEEANINIVTPHSKWQIVDKETKASLYLVVKEDTDIKVYGKWQDLAVVVSSHQKENYQKILDIFVKKMEEKGIDKNKVRQILNDKFIQDRIFATLNTEILQKIDFEGALKGISKSEEVEKLLADMKYRNIFFGAMEGLWIGGAERLGDEANKYKSRTFFGSALNGFHLMYRVLLDRDKLMRQTLSSAQDKAFEIGWGETFRSIKDTVRKNDTAAKKIPVDFAKKIQLSSKLGLGLRALWYDQKLKKYVQDRYGKESAEAFFAALQEMATDPEVSNLLRGTKEMVEKQVVGMTSKVLLNKNKTGVNPAFLTFARERLLGKREPQIAYFPLRDDEAVNNGYEYNWQNSPESSVICYIEGTDGE
ncbi:hypothetical protein [Candidatus Uabimicrobium amorphum]|uniref:Uncharacterized protein n=1 Tax=Uabimicrobium amorphum TaxID=2596890 RepID=A0A5S9IST4_UABAM|nr:hypothetical protein [Candidatus Uabimicrobium amorphum]BBM86966.1 hypothetical protein UABAM_05368 [Candidatus Uabimicrobium amorphum]